MNRVKVKRTMSENINHLRGLIHSIPEVMIQNHGKYNATSTFKIEHSGETFCLPHYNLELEVYFSLYIEYLKSLIETTLDFSIFHMNDREHTMNLIKLNDTNNATIDDFINEQFHSKCYSFHIRFENTRQYDIERSLITTTTFRGECNVCYQTNELKHYYNCDIKDKRNHHGICGTCYIAWQRANPGNTCPLCRACKKTQCHYFKTTYS